MSLPQVNLDDRTFQQLVDEARSRIATKCPEWTEHNVSDPGIALIEAFAWMTEQVIFRLNRVPEKLHVALLDLLDVQLEPAAAARADVRFRLTRPAVEPVLIPARETEVATEDGRVVFRTARSFTIHPAEPVAVLRHADGALRELELPARPAPAFSGEPRPEDAIYLGFERSLARLVLSVRIEAEPARGVGVRPADPPLRWEVSGDDGAWLQAEVLEDTTAGFNREAGAIELQAPPMNGRATVAGRDLYWLRCTVTEVTRSGRRSFGYGAPPRLRRIEVGVVGALVELVHAEYQEDEVLGTSDHTAGQTFALANDWVLPLDSGEDALLVIPEPGAAPQRWESRESFRDSGPHDPHYRFDPAGATIELGPAIRHESGEWRHHGAIPPRGAELRLTGYWHGGGQAGNVAAGRLTVLRKALPFVSSVVNPAEATGGVDPETLAAGRERAALELRAGYRAVTREDFVFLAEEHERVARAFCSDPEPGEPVVVWILATPPASDERPGLAELTPSDALLEEVATDLDARRLAGTRVVVQPVPIVGVTVVAEVVVAPYDSVQRTEEAVVGSLDRFVHPVAGSAGGWGFGRPVRQADVQSVIEGVRGVRDVRSVRLHRTSLSRNGAPDRPDPRAVAAIALDPWELPASGGHYVRVDRSEHA